MGRRVSAKKRRKYWITVYAPEIFGGKDKPLTKVLYSEVENLINRIVTVKGSELLGSYDPEDRGMSLYFRIIKVTPGGAWTTFIGHELSNEIVLSKVRRRMSKIETIFRVYTKDGHRIKVSMLAMTTQRCHDRHKRAIRKMFEEFVTERAKEFNYEEFLYNLVIVRKWHSELIDKANKIYPIREFLIFKTRVETVIVDKDDIPKVIEGEDEILKMSETYVIRG
ncbi:MAG: hypothetical protein ACP6IP_00030 [Candidatus Njordarchaeia archaeon]